LHIVDKLMSKIEQKIFVGFVTIILITGLFAGYTFRNMRLLIYEAEEIGQSLRILHTIETISFLSLDIETGARGYLLTHDESYLRPYNVSVDRIDEALSSFIVLADKDSLPRNESARLHRHVLTLVDTMASLISSHQNKALSQSRAIEGLGKAKAEMEAIRIIINTIENRERQVLSDTNLNRIRKADQTIISFILLVIVVIISLAFLFIWIRREFMLRRSAEKKLNETKDLLQGIVDFSPSLIFIKDTQGRYLLANKAFQTVLNIDPGSTQGKKDEDLFPKPFAAVYREHDREVAASKSTIQTEEQVPALHGEIKTFMTSKFPLFNEKGKVYAICGISSDISDRVQAQNELQKTKNFLQSIIDYSPAVIFTKDLEGRFMSLNRIYEQYFEVSAEHYIGHTDYEFFPKEIADRIREKERSVVETRSYVTYEQRSVVNGRDMHFLTTKFPLYDENGDIHLICGISTDISQIRNAEKQLKEYADRVYDLYNNAPCGYHSINQEGYFIEMNDTELEWLGYTREEVIGKMKLVDVLTPECAELSARLLEKVNAGTVREIKDYEQTLIRKNGSTFEALINASFVWDSEGKPIHSRTIVLDVTDRKTAAEKINLLNIELERNNSRLQEVNYELESFSYSVSHDLRSPLRAIDGYARILLEDYSSVLNEEGKRVLNVILSNARRMSQLIDDLLEFSRLGRRELTRSVVEMNDLVSEVIRELQVSSDEVRIFIHTLPEVRGDWTMLRQVWLNLVSNALKYSSKKEERTIEIGCQIKETTYEFFVRDNGAGFDMHYAHKLFQVFQRLHSEEEFEGTGVGLAIVQRVVTRHGGEVWAESKKGEGAVFYFSLPRIDN
jgi:PAS domain S-box-containing protein